MSNVMSNIDSKTWRAARRALEKAIALYLNDPNVSHIDLGYRMRTSKGNQIAPELVVRVHVHRKLSGVEFEEFAALHPDRVIDAQKIGFPVDVIQASYSLQSSELIADIATERQDAMPLSNQFNPIFGTLGGQVRDLESGEEMFLTAWHLLAPRENPDSDFYIQHPEKRGDLTDQKSLIKSCRNALSASLDAAVVQLDDMTSATSEQSGIVSINGSAMPQLGMKTIKSGGATGITRGIISGILGYSIHQFNGEGYAIGPAFHISSESPGDKICDPGDSGAWWLEQNSRRAVGLHFAGSTDSKFALALAMPDVLEALHIQIVSAPTEPSLLARGSAILTNAKLELIPEDSILSAGTGETVETPEIQSDFKLVTEDASNFSDHSNLKRSLKQLDIKLIFRKLSTFLNKDTGKIYFKFVQLSLLILLSIIMVKFGYYQPKKHQQFEAELDHLKNTLAQITTISQIEREQDYTIKKIIAIINQHNPEMASDLKFKIAREIYEMSIKYTNLNLELICATITHESAKTWNPRVVSSANARGLMQILPATGVFLAKEEGLDCNQIEEVLFDPILNIRLGCRYLSSLIEAYNIDGGLAAYNGGIKRAESWVRNGRARGILHEETDKYVPSVLKIYGAYRRM